MIAGILFGLGAATCQSLSYIFSTVFMLRFRARPHVLLVLAHMIMGFLSAVLLPLVWSAALPPPEQYARPLLLAVVFYLAGQFGLFLSLRRAEASRVSPLLGLKLPILALLGVLFLGERYAATQWLAVGMTLCAALILRGSGRRLAAASLGWILLACLGYSLSDIHIRMLVVNLQAGGLSLPHAATLGVFLSYIVCGLLAACFLPAVPWRQAALWPWAAPFALAWLASMLLLFACFGALGVVFGNIVQASRGMISILLGVIIAAAGYVRLESRAGPGVWARRAAAAILMILAVTLFSLRAGG